MAYELLDAIMLYKKAKEIVKTIVIVALFTII